MVARLLVECGVLPSGIMTSHITSTPLVRAASGNTATGFRTQSELWPSACMVDEPSKPHNGSCSSVGKDANSLIWVLPRKFGVGVYPSSQIYSSLYFVIEPLCWSSSEGGRPEGAVPPPHTRLNQPFVMKHFVCQPLQCGGETGGGRRTSPVSGADQRRCGIGARSWVPG